MFSLFKEKSNTDQSMETYLVAGLGNPGREYKQTRHNIGFMVAEQLSNDLSISMGKVQSRAIIGMGRALNSKIIIARPQTYMNRSGEAVKGLLKFYKIPLENLIVIHDDLDIPFGTIRIRKQGGPGGQKGVKSIIDHMGTQDFNRIRMGIDRPPGRMDAADYVLQRFSRNEEDQLEQLVKQASKAIQTIITNGMDQAMNEYNGQAL